MWGVPSAIVRLSNMPEPYSVACFCTVSCTVRLYCLLKEKDSGLIVWINFYQMSFVVRYAGRVDDFGIDIPHPIPDDFVKVVNDLCRGEFQVVGGSVRNITSGNAATVFSNGGVYEYRGGNVLGN